MTWKESQRHSDNEHDQRNEDWPMQVHRGGCRSGLLEMFAADCDKLDVSQSKGNENNRRENCKENSNSFSCECDHSVSSGLTRSDCPAGRRLAAALLLGHVILQTQSKE